MLFSVSQDLAGKPAANTFSNPIIFSLICPYHDNEVVSRCIVRVKKVRDDAQQPKAAGKNDELILSAEFVEEVLLVFLVKLSVCCQIWDSGSESDQRQ